MSDKDGREVAELLQKQLSTYNDLHLTLKHVHWNVVGPNFIGVHEMIDPQVDLVRGYADEAAERIAALGRIAAGHARARSSRTARGTTTRSAATPCSPTWRRSTWSTPVSTRTPARPSTRSTISTRCRRTCSSATPASWRSSSGSSAHTWRAPVASCPTRQDHREVRRATAKKKPGQVAGRMGPHQLARARSVVHRCAAASSALPSASSRTGRSASSSLRPNRNG